MVVLIFNIYLLSIYYVSGLVYDTRGPHSEDDRSLTFQYAYFSKS